MGNVTFVRHIICAYMCIDDQRRFFLKYTIRLRMRTCMSSVIYGCDFYAQKWDISNFLAFHGSCRESGI